MKVKNFDILLDGRDAVSAVFECLNLTTFWLFAARILEQKPLAFLGT